MAAEYAYNLHQTEVPVTIPAPQRQPARAPRPTIVPKQKGTPMPAEMRRRLERRSNVIATRIFAVMAAAIVLMGIFCYSFILRERSRRQLQQAETSLSEYCEANVVLHHKLSKLVSADNIDRVATQRLKLVKMANGDTTFLQVSESNQVLVSQSKN